MKNIFLVLALVLGQTAYAASGSGNVSMVANVCGLITSANVAGPGNAALVQPTGDLGTPIVLVGSNTASNAGHYYGLYSTASPGSTTFYQVPNGKTLYVLSINMYANSAADVALLGYGSAALGAEDTNTPPAGEVDYSPTATQYNLYQQTASVWMNFPMPMSFPQNSFPFWKAGVTSQIYSFMICGVLK